MSELHQTVDNSKAIENNGPPAAAQINSSHITTITSTTTNTRISNPITTNAPMHWPEADLSTGRKNLRKWLGKTFRVVISDGRVLVGFFNCTDKDANVVLSMCAEYLEEGKDARILGNVMIPGKHIISISVDLPKDEALKTNETTVLRQMPAEV